jgi:ectoine hydroxylase-related dioxygenase (phytanoyl-CoA dioxygenase family)
MGEPVSFAADPEAALACYLRDGVFVEPDVLSGEECDALLEAAQGLPTVRDGTLLPLMQVHRLEPRFGQLLSHPAIVRMMDIVCGGAVVGIQTQFYFTPPQRAGLGFHQDNYFVEAPDNAFASAWVPLVDTGPRNGGLYAFRGSHKLGRLPVRQVNAEGRDKRETVYEETVIPPGLERFDIVAKRGSAVLIHGHVVHGSHQNESDSNRFVNLSTYVREGSPFRPGKTARREAVPLVRA